MIQRIGLLAIVLVGFVGPRAHATPPADPDGLTRATLECGLEVWVHPSGRGSGEVAALLVVRASPLDENDDELGAAYLGKRAAGFGTPSVAPERLEMFRFVRRAGGAVPRPIRPELGQHAALSYDATVYTLGFSADEDARWNDALTHYRDLLSGWVPPEDHLARARSAARDRVHYEKPEERARRAFLPELLPGSRIGTRQIVPAPEVLEETRDDAIRRYIARRYQPGSSAIVLVGDLDPSDAINRVSRAFKGVPRGGAPDRAVLAGDAPMSGRVTSHSVEGYEPAEVAFIACRAMEESSDAEHLRREVLERLAAAALEDHFRERMPHVSPGVTRVEASAGMLIPGYRIAEISVRMHPFAQERSVEVIGEELASLLAHGLDDQRCRDARERVTDSVEQEAEKIQALGVYGIARQIESCIRFGNPWIPVKVRSELARGHVTEITDDEINATLRSMLAPELMGCVMLTPAPEQPGRAELGTSALKRLFDPAPVALHPVPVPEIPDSVGPVLDGEVDDLSHQPVMGVWTARLSNGFIVRHRRIPGMSGTMVRVRLCDGEFSEGEEERGLTAQIEAGWRTPATTQLSAGQVSAWSMDHGVTFDLETDGESVVLVAETNKDDPSAALELLAGLLHQPQIDPRIAAGLEVPEQESSSSLIRLGELLYGEDDPRTRATPGAETIDLDRANAWLRRVTRAPAEVSIVSGNGYADDLSKVAARLGGLEARDVPSRERPLGWDPMPAGDPGVQRVFDDEPGVMFGLVFGDGADLARVRTMVVALELIRADLRQASTDGALPGEPSVSLWLGGGARDRATLIVQVLCAPDQIDPVGRAVRQMLDRYADSGPDSSQTADAVAGIAGWVDSQWEEPAYWSRRLCRVRSAGQGLEDLVGMREAYASVTAEQIRDLIAGAMDANPLFRIEVRPPTE